MNDLTKTLNVSTRKERTNMKKVICCILLSVCLCTLLIGCGRDDIEEFKANKAEEIRDDVYEFVDPDTGVHYWIYSNITGNSGQGGMTPRLNSDGTVMVTK